MDFPLPIKSQRLIFLAAIAISPVFFFQGLKLGLYPAHARSGDEPHYLTILNSIVRDADLDLRNNYRERQSGLLFRDFEIDHHTYLVSPDGTTVIPFEDAYRMEKTDAGRYELRRSENHPDLDLSRFVETPLHSAGYPALLAPFLYPFVRFNFDHYETIAVILQLAYFALAVTLLNSMFNGSGFAAFSIVALSTPVWVLNASFYAEGVIGSVLIFLLYGYLKKNFWMVALHIPILVFIKEIYIPVAGLFGVAYIFQDRRSGKRLIPLLFFIASMLLFLLNNHIRYSNPFRSYIPYVLNPDPIQATVQLLISDTKGILAFTPHLVILPFTFFLLYRRSKRDFLLLLFAISYLLLATLFHKNWSGGPSFSYRTVAPALFMLFPYILYAIDNSGRLIWPLRILLAISLLNMLFAISNLHFSYASAPFINPIRPTNSILYSMVFRH